MFFIYVCRLYGYDKNICYMVKMNLLDYFNKIYILVKKNSLIYILLYIFWIY